MSSYLQYNYTCIYGKYMYVPVCVILSSLFGWLPCVGLYWRKDVALLIFILAASQLEISF